MQTQPSPTEPQSNAYLLIQAMKSLQEKYIHFLNPKPFLLDNRDLFLYIHHLFTSVTSSLNDHLHQSSLSQSLSFHCLILSYIFSLIFPHTNKDHTFYYGALKESLSKNIPSYTSTLLQSTATFPQSTHTTIKHTITSLTASLSLEQFLSSPQTASPFVDNALLEIFEHDQTKLHLKRTNTQMKLSLQDSLDLFVSELKHFDLLDIDVLVNKCIPQLNMKSMKYIEVYKAFQSKYTPTHNDNNNTMYNKPQMSIYTTQKTLYCKLLYLILTSSNYFLNSFTQSQTQFTTFLHNLQLLVFYIYITLEYVEQKHKVIQLTLDYLEKGLNTNIHFCPFTFHTIISLLLKYKETLPFNINNIIMKCLNDFLSFVIMKSQSKRKIQGHEHKCRVIGKNFFIYCFEIINKISNKLNTISDKRETIFNQLKQLLAYNEGEIIENIYIDECIIFLFAVNEISLHNNPTEHTKHTILNHIRRKYIDEKKKTLLPDISEHLINDNTKWHLTFDIVINTINNKNTTKPFLYCLYDYKALLLTSSKDYNTIYSHQPTPTKTNNVIQLLNKKRIRVLTPTISEKTMISSPFTVKFDYFNKADTALAVSAFKNLNLQFQS